MVRQTPPASRREPTIPSPRVTYFRHGEICLLLRPKSPHAAAAQGRFDADYLTALRGALEGIPLYDNPFQGPLGPRTPIPMDRGGELGMAILQTVNIAGWVPAPDRLDHQIREVDEYLTRSMENVTTAVELINERTNTDLGEYLLMAASPNWNGASFEDGV